MQKQNQTSNICNTSQIQFSNAHNKTEVADASTSQDNVPASVKKSPFEDKCSNTHNKTEVIDASTSQNNVPALVLETHLRDLCFDALGKTEVIDASVQKAPITNLNSAATVSDQKACKESLQKLQLKSDGSPTDLGKDVADATHPICNGADGLLGANDQATEPQPDPFCKPIPDNDTEPIVQIIPTETSVQNHSLDSGQVSSKKICSEDSSQMVCSEDCAQRIKRRLRSSMNAESIASDQQASTSETVHAEGTSCKSRRRKHSCCAASSEDGVQVCNKKQNLGDSTSSVGLTIDNQDSKDASLSSAELARSDRSSVANPDSGKCATRNEKGSSHFDLLTRGLRQITVSRWDDNDMPDTTETELQRIAAISRHANIDETSECPEWKSADTGITTTTRGMLISVMQLFSNNTIASSTHSYQLVRRDEEYDRGRRKKVKRPIKDFGGPNPFQETANIRSWQGMGLKAEQARRGNQPLRK
ncbi:hypothetical protein PR202_ga03046 [Eleusine coracana subsp. coracana]|uniref:Uncharacterized protein n=1 Tax=Eleusine coracana subsp. coracana TaxID=191504 RepID=A0AAV5BME3_ELECO|nr:hypothetical protein PR202_ga03046 [Eleusine coracana subsp. coracana]